MEHVDKVPAEFKLKGTEFVLLKMLSAGEQQPWLAQIRGLVGKHLNLFIRSAGDEIWDKVSKVGQESLNESELAELHDRALQKSREIVLAGVLRLFEVNGDSVQHYKVSDKPIGEHKTDEVSLDLLVGDHAYLAAEIMRLSSRYMGGLAADTATPFRPNDEGTAGRVSEEIRGEASRVG